MLKEKVLCRYCHQADSVKKHGTARSGYQRYLCSACQRTFQVKYIYQVYKQHEEKKPQRTARSKETRMTSGKENNIVSF